MIQKRKEVEERTLASSERGLDLLFESEKVGSATAVELTRQKEQLLNTESKLDEINSSLRQSERHLQGIRSVFGSIKNYFSGHSSSNTASGQTGAGSANSNPAPGQVSTNRNTAQSGMGSSPGQNSYNNFNNRVSQSHNNISEMQKQQGMSSAVDEQLDRNLDDMATSLARLKGLAQGLNTELDEHNDILERVNDKADMVGFKVDKQNKDMNKILKK